MRRIKLKAGPLKGRTLEIETVETVEILCTKCNFLDKQTFFVKERSDKDIGRKCPKCGGELKLGLIGG